MTKTQSFQKTLKIKSIREDFNKTVRQWTISEIRLLALDVLPNLSMGYEMCRRDKEQTCSNFLCCAGNLSRDWSACRQQSEKWTSTRVIVGLRLPA